MSLTTVILLIAYDGQNYFGWQKTRMGPSIEETLSQTLSQLLQQKITLQAASRTDRGVHAFGQVASFQAHLSSRWSEKSLQKSLNSLLAKDIAIRSIAFTHSSFHPTMDATLKEYHYCICNTDFQLPSKRFNSWHFPYPLNISLMQRAALEFIKEEDFSSFCNDRPLMGSKSMVRHITDIEIVQPTPGGVLIIVKGKSFLYKMVRNLTGTLAYIGSGKMTFEDACNLLSKKNRVFAGMTAPSHGLTLWQVYYPNLKQLDPCTVYV